MTSRVTILYTITQAETNVVFAHRVSSTDREVSEEGAAKTLQKGV